MRICDPTLILRLILHIPIHWYITVILAVLTTYILDSVLRLSSRYRSGARKNLLHLSLGEMCWTLALNINIVSGLEALFANWYRGTLIIFPFNKNSFTFHFSGELWPVSPKTLCWRLTWHGVKMVLWSNYSSRLLWPCHANRDLCDVTWHDAKSRDNCHNN